MNETGDWLAVQLTDWLTHTAQITRAEIFHIASYQFRKFSLPDLAGLTYRLLITVQEKSISKVLELLKSTYRNR